VIFNIREVKQQCQDVQCDAQVVSHEDELEGEVVNGTLGHSEREGTEGREGKGVH
jgi:hypothetical protein